MNDWYKETLYKAKEHHYIDRAKKMVDSGVYEGFAVEELARFLFDKDYS
jgi:hypothetical protein